MPTPPPPARLVCFLALALITCGAAGCGAARRPDGRVARAVEREERRLAAEREERLTALAAADLAPMELASAGVAIEALALLYVPKPTDLQPHASARRAPSAAVENPNWVKSPPPSWLAQPWPDSMAFDSNDGDSFSSVRGLRHKGHKGLIAFESDKAGGKPKLRMNLFNLHVRGRPVSFSTSLKGLKGVQVKATIKM